MLPNGQHDVSSPRLFDQKILDGLGKESAREVLLDDLKSRFFTLGLQVGISLQVPTGPPQLALCTSARELTAR